MRLRDFNKYSRIYIQTHDNPDADALASGFGLYAYFKSQGADVTLFYSGQRQIQKSNLKIMVHELEIPVVYIAPPRPEDPPLQGLLITVDCQYGASNVTRFEAENVYIIDHHQVEADDVSHALIRPDLGGCSTLVWRLLGDEGFDLESNLNLCTALYYGLSMDTNIFAEITHPYDKDLRDSMPYKAAVIRRMNNANISIGELEMAGVAMIRAIHNDEYRYALIHTAPCDPNLLGVISDFLLQVDQVDTCIVYYQDNHGIKYSVRSCIKEVKANELASYVAEDIGSGGGHMDKAGGYIPVQNYEFKYPTEQTESYFSNTVNRYFSQEHIAYAREYKADYKSMDRFQQLTRYLGYLPVQELVSHGRLITIRSIRGDLVVDVDKGGVIMVNYKGEVYLRTEEDFDKAYKHYSDTYDISKTTRRVTYPPSFMSPVDGEFKELSTLAHTCVQRELINVYAAPLTERLKLFPIWDEENYILGEPGDFIVIPEKEPERIYLEPMLDFEMMYAKI